MNLYLRQPRLLAFITFAGVILLLSSGRVGSSDAGAQLAAARLLVTTGHAWTPTPPTPTAGPGLWVETSPGRYYEAHDVGALILLIPAAVGGQIVPRLVDDLGNPLVSRVFASLSYGLLAAFGCVGLFALLQSWFSVRTSVSLVFVFLFATTSLPYAKTAWDVTGAWVGLVWLMAELAPARGIYDLRSGLRAGAFAAAACAFRFSVTPFLALFVLVYLVMMRHVIPHKFIGAVAVSGSLCLLPSLLYNVVRTGDPLRPLTTAAQFSQTRLDGNALVGAPGLFFSPSHGAVAFMPILLLLFLVPMHWRDLDARARSLIAALGVFTVSYALMIGQMRWWFAFGWGPRYLVPVLPALFFPIALILPRTRGVWRAGAIAVTGLSVAVNLAAVLVNWQLAVANAPESDGWTMWPVHQVAVWLELSRGLLGAWAGRPLGSTAEGSIRFPDLLLGQVASLGTEAALLASFVALGVSASVFISARRLWRQR